MKRRDFLASVPAMTAVVPFVPICFSAQEKESYLKLSDAERRYYEYVVSEGIMTWEQIKAELKLLDNIIMEEIE